MMSDLSVDVVDAHDAVVSKGHPVSGQLEAEATVMCGSMRVTAAKELRGRVEQLDAMLAGE
jgi:hypothetical protein